MVLKQDVVSRCLSDNKLFFDLCEVTGRKPGATSMMLYRNKSIELRTIDVIGVIKIHTGLKEEDILIEPTKSIVKVPTYQNA